MNEIYLDGAMMINREVTHDYIAEQIELPYGSNLDALFDVLTTLYDSTIYFYNSASMLEYLGDYGYALLKVMKDAEEQNDGLTVTFTE